ncbi:hypothetical protein X975_15684, partial [Stegodyphus mimosarum]
MGCPQGSCARPHLWNVTFKDIIATSWPDYANIHAYADDVAFIVKDSSTYCDRFGISELVSSAEHTFEEKISPLFDEGVHIAKLVRSSRHVFPQDLKERLIATVISFKDFAISGSPKEPIEVDTTATNTDTVVVRSISYNTDLDTQFVAPNTKPIIAPANLLLLLLPPPTFAEVLKQTKRPSLILKTKAKKSSAELRKELQEEIPLAKLPVSVERITPTAQGGLEVYSRSSDGIAKLEEHLTRADVNDKFRRRQKRKLRCAIHNVPIEVAPKEFSALVSELSASTGLPAGTFKILFRLKERRPNRVKWIMECEPQSFTATINIRIIFTGWQPHIITEFLGTKRCYKYQEFGHTQDVCTIKDLLLYYAFCASNHSVRKCTADHPECINCGDADNRYGTQSNFNRPAYHPYCPVYQRAATNIRNITDY